MTRADISSTIQAPLVGERLPCEQIAQEYAKADPVYIEKTLVSTMPFSSFTPIGLP